MTKKKRRFGPSSSAAALLRVVVVAAACCCCCCSRRALLLWPGSIARRPPGFSSRVVFVRGWSRVAAPPPPSSSSSLRRHRARHRRPPPHPTRSILVVATSTTARSCSSSSSSPSRGEEGGEGGGPSSEDDPIDSEEDGADGDWREFRARLVLSEGGGTSSSVPTAAANAASSSAASATTGGGARTDDDDDDRGKTTTAAAAAARDDCVNENENDGRGRAGAPLRRWAYETGDLIERGTIVVSVPSSDAFLDDVDSLESACYRKSIVLVLDVGNDYIRGIVLNRPTAICVGEGMRFVRPGRGEVYEDELGGCLGDDCELMGPGGGGGGRWKVWFGGEVGGPYSDRPRVVCLHSLSATAAADVSDPVLPGIHATTFESARSLVRSGCAVPSDFWLFCGICGWEKSAFYGEMHGEGLWHAVSADSGTILEELNMLRCEEEEEEDATTNCDVDRDPRNAGLNTWEMLMGKIGRSDEAQSTEDSFGDLMLREWATGTLSFSSSVGEEQQRSNMIMDPFPDPLFEEDFDLSEYDPASAMTMDGASSTSSSGKGPGMVGVMARASSATRSPYLLSDQGYHKSLILTLHDGDDYSEGILLNHVTSRSLRLDLVGRTVVMPIRYGGPAYYFAKDEEDDEDDGEMPTIYLHANESIRDAGVGVPIGKSRLYKCTKEEVVSALRTGLGAIDDFIVVQGSSIWTKKGEHTGILGDIEAGFFEIVPRPKVREIWDVLQQQDQLSAESLGSNMFLSRLAWDVARRDADGTDGDGGTPEKDRIHVFGTDVDVATLADEAALRWVKVNLLS